MNTESFIDELREPLESLYKYDTEGLLPDGFTLYKNSDQHPYQREWTEKRPYTDKDAMGLLKQLVIKSIEWGIHSEGLFVPRSDNTITDIVSRAYSGFGEDDFYPAGPQRREFITTAISGSHIFHDGNKRASIAIAEHYSWVTDEGYLPVFYRGKLATLAIMEASTEEDAMAIARQNSKLF